MGYLWGTVKKYEGAGRNSQPSIVPIFLVKDSGGLSDGPLMCLDP